MSTTERISDGEQLIALIIQGDHRSSGVEFFTQPSMSLQLASMGHPKGKKIGAHVHREKLRAEVSFQEVLFIKEGRLKVDLYRKDRTFLTSRVLGRGDVILLAEGGHGFEALEDLQMIEVKQGPYDGAQDKLRFQPEQEE